MFTDTTLIRAGPSQDVGSNGQATYTAWWEIIPAPSVPVSLAVTAGNTVSVNIAETTPQVWSITINNVSTGQSWSTTVPYSSAYATAEWIEETPVVIDSSGAVTVGPLPRLSQVTFDAGTVNGGNPGLRSSEEMQLVDTNGAALVARCRPRRSGGWRRRPPRDPRDMRALEDSGGKSWHRRRRRQDRCPRSLGDSRRLARGPDAAGSSQTTRQRLPAQPRPVPRRRSPDSRRRSLIACWRSRAARFPASRRGAPR